MAFKEQQPGKVGLWDRVRNVFTDELAKEADIRKDERDRVTTELNHQLLEMASDVKREWHDDLEHGMSDPERQDEAYRSYIEGLSAAQQRLQDANSGIETDIDPLRIRSEAGQGVASERAAEQEATWNDLGPAESLQDETYGEDVPVEQFMVDSLRNQEQNIREEWRSDLEAGRMNRHALDSYFAGRIDQHNTLIDMSVKAHPELRATLPPPIQYSEMRQELQQQVNQRQDVSNRAAEIAREEARYMEQLSQQEGFRIAV